MGSLSLFLSDVPTLTAVSILWCKSGFGAESFLRIHRRCSYNPQMAMGRQSQLGEQEQFWIAHTELPRTVAHPFYEHAMKRSQQTNAPPKEMFSKNAATSWPPFVKLINKD
jgi:hypothetical protein